METPVQVSFRGIDVSDAVESECWAEAEKLERFHDHIISCRVVIGPAQKRHTRGSVYDVRVIIVVPGKELVVNREPPPDIADEDIFVAVHEAFATARRLVEEHGRKVRGMVKAHEGQPHGRVGRLLSSEGYGFIRTTEGREVYFHRNSVLHDGFDHLREGDEVRFVEEDGDKGPQASTVTPVGKRPRG